MVVTGSAPDRPVGRQKTQPDRSQENPLRMPAAEGPSAPPIPKCQTNHAMPHSLVRFMALRLQLTLCQALLSHGVLSKRARRRKRNRETRGGSKNVAPEGPATLERERDKERDGRLLQRRRKAQALQRKTLQEVLQR